MALNIKTAGNQNNNRIAQENIEPGVYPARLVQIIDLGLQAQRPFQGKDKPPAQEIMLTYELVDEFMKDEDGNPVENKPRWVSETLPFYGLHADKAKSTQRYLALDPKGDYDGDFTKAIESPCNVTIVNNAGKDGKVYDNVAHIAAMRPKDAIACPELVNPSKVFDCDNPDMDVFNKLPEWIQKKIKENLNYEGSTLQKLVGSSGAKSPATSKNVQKAEQVDDADVAQPVDDDAPY
mgnify:CR=1 FL=1